jgi:hypothetical protein
MATGAEAVTARVVTVNVALVCPAGMVTLPGTVAADVLLVERETRAPPLGAGALSVALPVEGDPPLTLVGFNVSEVRVGPDGGCGVTVSGAVHVTPAYDADMVTEAEAATCRVVTVKAALAAPACMVMLAGTVATAVLLLERDTRAPPPGAGALSVTLPVEGEPPLTLVGFRISEVRVGPDEVCGVTVSEAVRVTPT